MDTMFFDARAFNQDIGGWDVSDVVLFNQMFDGSGLAVSSTHPTLPTIYSV